MAYQVRLEVFEGPFDLLLHLIAKREVDIYEVSLATITEDYLEHLKQMQELDLEVATEFLVVAATLIEIKASRLLPGREVDDEEALLLSERDLLIARLLEYRAFKDAAANLADLLRDNAAYHPRAAGPGPEYAHLAPDLLARVSPQRLAEIAANALAPKQAQVQVLDLSHITPIRATVAEAIAEVLRTLEGRERVTFKEITASCHTRIDIVVRFLALLELIKQGEADVDQADVFGDIEVRRKGEGASIEDVVARVDEYRGAPEGDAQ